MFTACPGGCYALKKCVFYSLEIQANTRLSQRWQWDLEAPQISSSLWLINCLVYLPISWLTGIISTEPTLDVWMNGWNKVSTPGKKRISSWICGTQTKALVPQVLADKSLFIQSSSQHLQYIPTYTCVNTDN